MDLDLKGKVALITGASEGLGYGCARMLAAEGARTIISSRNQDKLSAASQAITRDFGVECQPIAADIRKPEDRIRLSKELKHVDILIISTGHPPTYPFSKATDDQWAEGNNLIIEPARHLPKLFIESMKANTFGRIIFIGSIFGLEPERSSVIQSTYRTGLNALSKCISLEYAEYGITSNVICPGYYKTPLVDNLALQYAKQENKTHGAILDDWKKYSPVKAFGNPDDLGAFVAFLCSPKAAFITGHSHVLDGGALHRY